MVSQAVERLEYGRRKDLLVDHMLRKSSLEELIRTAARLMDSPIILTTNTYRVLVLEDNGYEFEDHIWEVAKEWGYLDAESIALFETEGITREVHRNTETILLDKGIAKDIPRLLKKIDIYGRPGAYIGVLQLKEAFDEVDFKTVDVLADILSVMLERTPDQLHPEKEIRESILADLITGEISTPAALSNRMSSAFWEPLAVFECLLMTPAGNSEVIENAEYLALTLRNAIPVIQVINVPEGILVLLNEKSEQDFRRHEAFMREMAEQYDLQLNTSREFRDLMQLRIHYKTCLLIREIARKTRRQDRLTRFGDVVFEALAERIGEEGMQMFASAGYKKLAAYDSENDTDYCRTLMVYAECACNAAAAAAKLYIHRNTMAKRLARIDEICGIDPSDGRALMHFYMTARFFA